METKEKPKRKRKPNSTTPHSRRDVAIAKIGEYRGNVGKALKEAGYSDAYAKNPSQFTSTKAYKELIEEFLPDEMLLTRHSEIINAPRIKRTFIKGQMVEETEETDPSQVRGLDMAYKLKGKYQSEGVTNNVLIVQLSDTSSGRFKPVPVENNEA